MDHGLQVYNTSGSLQIDSKYKNLVLTGSGTVICTGNSFGYTRYADVNIVGNNPILAFRDSNYGVTCAAFAKVGNVYSFRIYVHFFPTTDDNIPVNYWVFDTISNTATPGHGLHVYNSSSQLVYDSNLKYFKVLNPNIPSGSTLYSGKSVLTAICDIGYSVFWTEHPVSHAGIQHVGFIFAKVTGGNTVQKFAGEPSFGSPTGSPQPSYGKPGAIAALDVTGYGL